MNKVHVIFRFLEFWTRANSNIGSVGLQFDTISLYTECSNVTELANKYMTAQKRRPGRVFDKPY